MSTSLAAPASIPVTKAPAVAAPAPTSTAVAPWAPAWGASSLSDPLSLLRDPFFSGMGELAPFGGGLGSSFSPFGALAPFGAFGGGSALAPFTGGLGGMMQNLMDKTSSLIRISVQENDNAFLYSYEVPGCAAGDVNVSVDGNVLTVSTNKRDSSSRTERDA